jgi:hypothetical protein
MILSIPILVKVLAIVVAAFAIAGIAYHDWHLLITPIASAAAGWLIMWPIRRRFDHFVEQFDHFLKQMNAGLDRIDQSLDRISQSIDRIEEADK